MGGFDDKDIPEEFETAVVKKSEYERMQVEMEDSRSTPVTVLCKVQKLLAQGNSTEDVRKALGIKGGFQDRRWRKIMRDLKPAMLSDEYLIKYVVKNDEVME